jgi:hypothetical protein
MTELLIYRTRRDRLPVPVATFVGLALAAVWEIDVFQSAPLEPIGVFVLGFLLGAMTGTGIVVRQRWRRFLANPT